MAGAKKKPAQRKPAAEKRSGRPVRLDLTETDHERLEAVAKSVGLNKAAYARQALFERMRMDEARGVDNGKR